MKPSLRALLDRGPSPRGSRADVTAHAFAGASMRPFTFSGEPETQADLYGWVHPVDFCRLASTDGGRLNQAKIRRYASFMRRPDAAFPVLEIHLDAGADDESEGLCSVLSHEGRHRAMAAHRLGIEQVPVIFSPMEATPLWHDVKQALRAGQGVRVWSQYFDDEEIAEGRGSLLRQSLVELRVDTAPLRTPLWAYE